MRRDVRCRPQRSLRSELVSLALVAVAPAASVAVFPFPALRFGAAEGPGAVPARCAFVSLSEAGELAAMDAARGSWKANAEEVRRLRANLSLTDIPEEPFRPLVSISERARSPGCASLSCALPPLPPTVASPAPERLAREPSDAAKDVAPFSRREMLEFN